MIQNECEKASQNLQSAIAGDLASAEKKIDTKLFLAACQMHCLFLVPGAPEKGTRTQAVFISLPGN